MRYRLLLDLTERRASNKALESTHFGHFPLEGPDFEMFCPIVMENTLKHSPFPFKVMEVCYLLIFVVSFSKSVFPVKESLLETKLKICNIKNMLPCLYLICSMWTNVGVWRGKIPMWVTNNAVLCSMITRPKIVCKSEKKSDREFCTDNVWNISAMSFVYLVVLFTTFSIWMLSVSTRSDSIPTLMREWWVSWS